MTKLNLDRLGWDAGWQAAFESFGGAGLVPARVAAQHRGAYDVLAEAGEVRAPGAQELVRDRGLPAVGDWVALDLEREMVEAVLPRRTAISRKETLDAVREQVLAANVDVAFLVQGLPSDFNVRRLERYLAMASESGAEPIVLLTKTDLVDDVAPFIAEIEAVTLGAVPVLAISVRVDVGAGQIRPFFEGDRTAVLLGSSGVGKSSLVNALAGEELLATRKVRDADQKGRHTTSHRQLIILPGGGVVLDTPGIRELQLWEADLDQVFAEIEELAANCRFADCSHETEPGCAVRAALADGTLSQERWDSYLKLRDEQAALDQRRVELERLKTRGRRRS